MAETALQRRYGDRLLRLRGNTLARVLAADTANTASFVDTVVPLVLASQEATVAQADAYLSAEAGLATGSSTAPWRLDAASLIGARARRGDFLEDVYGRNHRAAASTFLERMTREVNTDVTLADRGATYVHTAGDTRITGYRRVLSPGKNCGLCVAASSRLYHRSELRPIHQHCGCTTQAIYGNADNWQRPDNTALIELYRKAGGTDAKALGRLKINPADLPSGVDAATLPAVEVVDTTLGPTLVAA